MAARPQMKPLDKANFYNQDQSWYMKQHFEYKGRKLRFIIKRNAYEAQSSAIVQIQDETTLGWLGLGSIPQQQMKADACYAYTDIARGCKMHTFIQDLETLREIAKMLV